MLREQFKRKGVILSRTRQALELMRQNPKLTQRAAAKAVGLKSHTGVGAAKRQAKKTRKYRCGHCGLNHSLSEVVLRKD